MHPSDVRKAVVYTLASNAYPPCRPDDEAATPVDQDRSGFSPRGPAGICEPLSSPRG